MNIKATSVYERISKVKKKIIILRGGTRSSKSFSLMQICVIWLWTGHIQGKYVKKGLFTIARTTFPALRVSVLKDFINYLMELGIYQYVNHVKTVNEISFKGRTVQFISTDDAHKLRGIQRTFCWLNEANDMSYDIFNQIVIRLEKTMFLDVNPSGEPFVKTELEEKRFFVKKDVHIDVSTYKDNPFLPTEIIEEIQNLKNVDADLYEIYNKGNWVSLKGLIYPKVILIDEIPPLGRIYWGVDFGYNDPSVLAKVCIYKHEMYIDILVHEPNLLIDALADRIKEHVKRTDKVYCDSQEPRTIAELRRLNIDARAALKGRDSVRQGITFIKQHKIYLTSTSIETQKEWQRFKWEEDSLGRLTDKPINMYKHSSDAVMYAVTKALGNRIKLL